MPGVTASYDENGNVTYYATVPMGTDAEGGTVYQYVPVPASSVKSETISYPSEYGTESYQQLTIPSDVYQKAVDAVTAPPMPTDYTRPQEVTQSAVFQDVNPFSFGQLERIYDSINSGAYKVSPDKSQLITPYGSYGLQSLGNGLYDIHIGARSGSYNVAIGVTDDNKAVFSKDFLDKGAIRYQGGSPGGFISNMLNDLGPIPNIALAAYLGPGAGFLTNAAAQTGLNALKGQDFQDALTGGIISGGLTTGIGALTGGAAGPGEAGWGADLGYELPAGQLGIEAQDPFGYTSPYDTGFGAYDAATGDAGIFGSTFADDVAAQQAAAAAMPGTDVGIAGLTYGQGEGAFPGVEPGTVASDVAGTSGGIDTLYGQGEGAFPGATEGTVASDQGLFATTPDTTIYGQGEGAFPGPTEGTVASDEGLFVPTDSGMIYGQGEGAFPGVAAGTVASDVAGTGIDTGIIGGVGGIGLADILKYAGLAGLASTLFGGGKTAGGGGSGGPDQTPVGAGLSPDYKPYRYMPYAEGGITALADGGYNLGGYSDGGRLLRGPGDGVSDDIPATIGGKQPARLADGEFVVPARIVSELGNGSTDAGARKLYEMMDRVQSARRKTMGKKQFAKDTKADKYFPA